MKILNKMVESDIFCCGDKVPCISYKNDGLINFKFIEFKVDEVVDRGELKGCLWGFLLSGSLYVSGNEECCQVEAGEMFLLPEGEYLVRGISEGHLIYYSSSRSTDYCNPILNELPAHFNTLPVTFETLEIRTPLDKYLELLFAYLQHGINCKYFFEEKQQELFMVLDRCYERKEWDIFLHAIASQHNNDLRKFIIDNCCRARSVHELAEICGYSVGGFKRIFKEMFNEPVYRWMLQQKAERLKSKLLEKDLNLKVIVDEFGFSSPAHFTKFCKQWLGMVPTKFIKAQQDKVEL